MEIVTRKKYVGKNMKIRGFFYELKKTRPT